MLAIVALGSNLGDRRAHLVGGLAALASLGEVTPSPLVMETPDESGRGPAYLNTVALVKTQLRDPRHVLEALLRLELAAGRERSEGRNAPRTLDLDLITLGGVTGAWTWATPADLVPHLGPELALTLPHPRAFTRPFVLEPWRALEGERACLGVIPRT
ncbi:MAG TPA: 2-amino-4-hydroxy-6-hydroxymethyldihydropteridine diphosphokinase [Holophagaceae bacterium]|nr:2-amino-4-hydroxy-6-hydroxymethyldihydropteridine diphosphokinase [Holophagaceae bacterium]